MTCNDLLQPATLSTAMPELPDIVVYIEALDQRILGETLERVKIASPFLLRTAAPPISSVEGRKVLELRRLGKRVCIGLEEDFWLVLHLMIAGRLHWHERDLDSTVRGGRPVAARGSNPTLRSQARQPGRGGAVKEGAPRLGSKNQLAAFHFTNGTLSLTEAGSQRRASLHLVTGESLQRMDPGGLEIFDNDLENFARVLTSANHTLKRALTDPRLFSGIGNAYSDEILFDARLSPIALTQKLSSPQIQLLFDTTRTTLAKWMDLLRAEAGDAFPEKVTAFRPEMAVHGRYQKPCPRCGAKIQRIRYASNETNYCPNCQTGGKLLADRALSRLLRADWPRSIEELEGLRSPS
jgi:formamidopyrimidine-DNA glycosylase